MWKVWLIAILAGSAFAQKAQVPRPQDRLALAEDQVRELLQIMGPGKNGKISKQAFLQFMEAEFSRIDKHKSGQVDPKEITPVKVKTRRFAESGK
jgi:Ca2+-binding EF-hand superfamily protein